MQVKRPSIEKGPRPKKVSEDFTVQVDGVKGVCPAAETWAEDKIFQKKIPVLACESACFRGDIARRATNLVAKEEPFARACCAEVVFVPHSNMSRWVKEADQVIMYHNAMCWNSCCHFPHITRLTAVKEND